MFDMRGNVIGINSQILSPSGGNVGIGFAIPSEQAAPIVDTLRRGQSVKRGYLGIQISPLGEDLADSLGLAKNRGEFVQGVEPGKGADRAGIKAGDVIVSVAGQEVTPDQNLSSIVASQPIGSRVPIVLLRNGQRQTVTAIVGERPSEDELNSFAQQQDDDFSQQQDDQSGGGQATQQSLGISAIPLTPNIVRQLGIAADTRGIVITAVDSSTDAGAKGLRRGDVIITANNRPVASQADLDAAVRQVSSQGRNAILLQVLRRGQPAVFLPVRLRNK
jgi:serine protease Do